MDEERLAAPLRRQGIHGVGSPARRSEQPGELRAQLAGRLADTTDMNTTSSMPAPAPTPTPRRPDDLGATVARFVPKVLSMGNAAVLLLVGAGMKGGLVLRQQGRLRMIGWEMIKNVQADYTERSGRYDRGPHDTIIWASKGRRRS